MDGYGFIIKNFSTKADWNRYKMLSSNPREKLLEESSPISTEETEKRIKELEKEVRHVIDSLDDRGRWTEDGRMYSKRFYYKNAPEYIGPVMKNGWIRTRTFVRNMNTLSQYVKLLESIKAGK